MHIFKYLTAAILLSTPIVTQADVSILFQAGAIRQANGNEVAIGSIGVLIADTNNDGLGNLYGSTLNVSSALGGSDNIILGLFQAKDIGGVVGFSATINYDYASYSGFETNDNLYLVWFPTISAVGVTLGANVNYGYYRNSLADENSASDIGFVAPSDSSSPNLFVFDNVTNPGSAATPAELTALSYTAIPEPTSVALVTMGGALAVGAVLRRRKATA